MLVNKIMQVLSNLFGNGTKISASEIAIKNSNGRGITIENILNKSYLKIKKSAKSSFQLGSYGSTDIPLTEEEFKNGDKLELKDGSIVNVSNETLNVVIIYTCVTDNNIENGYMLAGVIGQSYTLIAFSTATNMSSSATFTEIATMKPNDKITMRIGKHSATSVGVETKTSIFVKEM